ncbi:MAG: adenylate/guanylate cyclase [Nitrospirae bacterium]|nr:MAG: adenylate/guanylate cyclase [Nitrospirota bacterium]
MEHIVFTESNGMAAQSFSTEDFFRALNIMLSTLRIDEILTSVVAEVRSILGADRCSLFIVDRENDQLYTKVIQASELLEIRLSLSKQSLAGYAALTGKVLTIHDVYDVAELYAIDPELTFDRRWDQQTGYLTKSTLVMPVPAGQVGAIAILQALNRKGGFADCPEDVLERLSGLLNIAVRNAMLYEAAEEEKRLREYIIDDIEEGICIINVRRQIVSANRFLGIMSGQRFPLLDMVGQDLFEIFPQLRDSKLGVKLKDVFEYGFKAEVLLEILRVKLIPHLDEHGRVRRVVLIFSRI